MKVPNFKGVQVCSKYDGRGVIERVFVDRNIHFAIKFQSNQTKNFFVPMAFNSGLLSTGNTQLNEYLQTLNQDDNFKKIVRPNDDIPTPTDLKITITDKYEEEVFSHFMKTLFIPYIKSKYNEVNQNERKAENRCT